MSELIDISLTPEEVAGIETTLASLEGAMPFLVSLSPERVKALFKLGPQSEAFVKKTLEAAEQHARLLPASTPIAAMRRDAELRETLRPIRAQVARLLELLDGTMILAGADLMKAASAVYRTLRIHAKGEGIEDTLEDLGKRFAKRGRAKPAAAEVSVGPSIGRSVRAPDRIPRKPARSANERSSRHSGRQGWEQLVPQQPPEPDSWQLPICYFAARGAEITSLEPFP